MNGRHSSHESTVLDVAKVIHRGDRRPCSMRRVFPAAKRRHHRAWGVNPRTRRRQLLFGFFLPFLSRASGGIMEPGVQTPDSTPPTLVWVFSPFFLAAQAAASYSLGCKPQDVRVVPRTSTAMSPRRGSEDPESASFQGLTPLAIRSRPYRAQKMTLGPSQNRRERSSTPGSRFHLYS